MIALVEVAVEDLEGARIAARAGAGRIELCAHLDSGGLTPTAALMEAVVALAGPIPVHGMVRCRAGSFVFDADEISLMEREARDLRAAGASGLVVGALTESAELDSEALARLVDAASGASVTIHRAFDLAPNWQGAVAQAIDLGVDRILTSGGARVAQDGIAAIRLLAEHLGDDIGVVVGGGVSSANVLAIVDATGATEVHSSGKQRGLEVSRDKGPFGSRTQPDRREVELLVRQASTVDPDSEGES